MLALQRVVSGIIKFGFAYIDRTKFVNVHVFVCIVPAVPRLPNLAVEFHLTLLHRLTLSKRVCQQIGECSIIPQLSVPCYRDLGSSGFPLTLLLMQSVYPAHCGKLTV
jgi:hypothetical protein